MEIRDIPNYEGLSKITSDAQIINVKTGAIKKVWVNNKGYKCVDLSKITSDAQIINVKTGAIKKVWVNNKGYKCVI